MEKIFESENLYFVKVDKSLINDYLKLMNDDDINKYLSFRKRIYDYEDELLWVNRNINNTAYSVIEKNSNEFVGNIEVLNIIDNNVVMGLAITKLKQNKHYGSESVKRFIDYYINELKYDGIQLSVYSHNKKALNCMQKIGFIEYDRIKNVGKYMNENVDDIYMQYKM